MNTPLFQQQRESIKQLLAEGIGCAPQDFDREDLTIADRPETTPWYTAMAVTFGTGIVVSVDPRHRAFVEAHAPQPRYLALYPELLQRMVTECSTPAEPLEYSIPDLWWALREPPAIEPPPEGFTCRHMGREWMATEMRSGQWPNGLGEPAGRDFREGRNQFAEVLFGADDEPVAIAGAFLTYGMYEIGVDVAPAYRGKGLAPVVVRSLAHEILERGETPLYVCAPTNIRSQRTALASGFMPVGSDASVAVASPR